MRIGFVGAGRIGATLAGLAVDRGHDVLLSQRRGPDSLAELVGALGARTRAVEVEEACSAGDLVVLAVPLRAFSDVPAAPLHGTVVVDAMNYYADRDGRFPALDNGSTTSSELVARHLRGARMVKAFNTIYFEDLATQGAASGAPGRRALPVASDDADAKALVSAFVDEVGFDVVDAGPLAAGRAFQPGAPAYNVRLTAAALRDALGLG